MMSTVHTEGRGAQHRGPRLLTPPHTATCSPASCWAWPGCHHLRQSWVLMPCHCPENTLSLTWALGGRGLRRLGPCLGLLGDGVPTRTPEHSSHRAACPGPLLASRGPAHKQAGSGANLHPGARPALRVRDVTWNLSPTGGYARLGQRKGDSHLPWFDRQSKSISPEALATQRWQHVNAQGLRVPMVQS